MRLLWESVRPVAALVRSPSRCVLGVSATWPTFQQWGQTSGSGWLLYLLSARLRRCPLAGHSAVRSPVVAYLRVGLVYRSPNQVSNRKAKRPAVIAEPLKLSFG